MSTTVRKDTVKVKNKDKKDNENKEIRSVQVKRSTDYEAERAKQEKRDKRTYNRRKPTDNEIQKEVRAVRYTNTHQGKIHDRHYYTISIPKSYCRIFGIEHNDMFVWSLAKLKPLTLTLTHLAYPADALQEEGAEE